MIESLFRGWLLQRYNESTAHSRVSNCNRIEEYAGNLDEHYRKDQGASLISKLTYSSDDQRAQRPARHNIPIDGNIYNGTATLKQAAKLYFDFKSGDSCAEGKTGNVTIRRQGRTLEQTPREPVQPGEVLPRRTQTDAPVNKIKDFEKDICKILAQLCHHIHPQIIKKIQQVNQDEYTYFQEIFHEVVETDNYLFPGSACVFPGVRRYVSGKGVKNQYNQEYRAIIDDNTFPRHLWCYLVNNKNYNGPNWKETGLNQFELAHIFTHKTSELDFEKQFFDNYNDKIDPHGEFTCGCNVVLLPKGTVRPTDNSAVIKAIFYQRYIKLYGVEPLNGRSGFKKSKVPDWYQELKWNDPFCPPDWVEKIENLMRYRKIRITQIIETHTKSRSTNQE